MDKQDFEKIVREYIQQSPDNYVKKEKAIRPELEGMRMFDEPLTGYACAEDPYFTEAKKPGIIGAHFIAPTEWLAGAKTVVSFFLPFADHVREANRQNMSWPADEWLHARIEGQDFIVTICRFVQDLLNKKDFATLVPILDPRFSGASPIAKDNTEQDYYTSNWSERHVAYAAGLGTFGLSKGLISLKGVAGRYFSIITSAYFEPDARPYKGIYDYCIFCGACASNCPAGAISKEKGKLHPPCSKFVDSVKEKCAPRYGCGKCQVKVPCETKAPKA